MSKGYLLSGVAAVALLLSNPIAVRAADIIPEEPIIADVFDWSGLYFGVHAGAGVLGTEGMYDNDGSSSSRVDLGALGGEIGGVFGGQVGFNWQAGNIVFGIEGDISFIGDLDNTAFPVTTDDNDTGIELENDFLASLRGRLGWADDNVLFYVTGGVAWYEGELSEKDTGGCTGTDCSVELDETGGVVGAGLEWGISENVSLRAEGLYYFFDDELDLNEGEDGGELLTAADTGDFFNLDDALVARLGINIRFNPF